MNKVTKHDIGGRSVVEKTKICDGFIVPILTIKYLLRFHCLVCHFLNESYWRSRAAPF